jgi:hypothetical protein
MNQTTSWLAGQLPQFIVRNIEFDFAIFYRLRYLRPGHLSFYSRFRRLNTPQDNQIPCKCFRMVNVPRVDRRYPETFFFVSDNHSGNFPQIWIPVKQLKTLFPPDPVQLNRIGMTT